MRVLLLGSGGMLAHDLAGAAPPDAEVVPLSHAEVDVTDEMGVARAVAETQPEVILNCAAYTNVDGAEGDREQAFAVNGRAPGLLGRVAAGDAHGSSPAPLLVHFSSDYVFGGRSRRPYREDDTTEPLGAYGASKLAGEHAVAQSGARYLIVRTSWLFGAHGRSFPRTMWQRATARQTTRVVNDQVGRPTYTVDLARAVWGLIGKREAGSGKPGHTLHVANSDQATWYDVAQRVFAAAGTSELLAPCATADYPTPAQRPAYSVLDTCRYEALSRRALPRWEDALDRFLGELRHG